MLTTHLQPSPGHAPKRVGIICQRYFSLGGMQTCLVELVAGLNERGIVPETIWDEPMDWAVLNADHLRAGFCRVNLRVSSAIVRRTPRPLAARLEKLRRKHARPNLSNFHFVYSLEAGLDRSLGSRGVVYTPGPQYVRVPKQRLRTNADGGGPDTPRLSADDLTGGSYSCVEGVQYVTIAAWLAAKFRERYGFSPQVVWPPRRERPAPPTDGRREGVLFLSRLNPDKRPGDMLLIARDLPGVRVTLAGSVTVVDGSRDVVRALRTAQQSMGLSNLTLLENPDECEVSRLLHTHSIFVFPGCWEHFGIVTAEAIAAGLLPIVHDSGGQREIVNLPELRYQSTDELVSKVSWALELSAESRFRLVSRLQQHIGRSSPAVYRQAMLAFMDGYP